MENNDFKLWEQPLKLQTTRVWRTYSGGKILEEWQGRPEPKDGELPEEWIASVTKARNNGREHIADEGLSRVELGETTTVLLKELIESNSVAFLGAEHVQKYGSNTAVLVKVLDSHCRLSIQVHPDLEFAHKVFHSQFGKTEAWYILGGREVDGEAPFLLLGFKPGISKEKWRELFEKQDIKAMVDCLHRIELVPGSTLLIEGGVPHAIGSGCFLVEIQEPTDYTIRVERTNPEGKTIPDSLCHQGIGFEKIFDCFHYDGYSLEETLQHWQIFPVLLQEGTGYKVTQLIGSENTDKFNFQRLEIEGTMECRNKGGFSILIVIAGSGRIIHRNGTVTMVQSNTIFLPAGLMEFHLESDPGYPLELVRCYPPQ